MDNRTIEEIRKNETLLIEDIKWLIEENQELKKQLESVDYSSVYIKGCEDTKDKYKNQQKWFIEYLEKRNKRNRNDNRNVIRYQFL